MTFRTRLLVAFGMVVLVPLLVFGLGMRREMTRRISADYDQRVSAQMRVFRNDLVQEERRIDSRLGGVQNAIITDNRFRTAFVRGEDRSYLLDFAGSVMPLTGLDFLQIQDDEGRVASSGHFRNEFDRVGPHVVGLSLVRAATAEGSFLALAASILGELGGRKYAVVGGFRLDSASLLRLTPDSEFRLRVVVPGDTAAWDSVAARANVVTLPYLDSNDPGTVGQARVILSHSEDLLGQLQRNVNLWFLVAFLVAALVALLLASWLSTRISRPLDAQLREMERRIAFGDLARQVNHDVKNGLAPLRNVFRHLMQVSRDEPTTLLRVFAERQGTVESSINYLETLAANYARLYPQSERKPTDVNAVVRDALGGARSVRAELAPNLPPVSADAVVLRRVIENLLTNAVDSVAGRSGTVTVSTEQGNGMVRILVTDTGRGMTKAELDRAFDDFHTTKPGGTGLGLSIVRRLVLDSNGSLRVETEPGKGSTFIVEIPTQ